MSKGQGKLLTKKLRYMNKAQIKVQYVFKELTLVGQ